MRTHARALTVAPNRAHDDIGRSYRRASSAPGYLPGGIEWVAGAC
jgi:hypothetical protein